MVVKQEDPFVVYFPCLSRHLCGMRIEEMLTLREEKRAAGNFWGRLSSFKVKGVGKTRVGLDILLISRL
ncbi:hypothetical protein JTE90_016697 [Oedothorax gibbosus]|uniref:Uncharacterized protein n=1 Tax=Oedothorax gibbosus TaxID=931172 RepID=A0AAV6V3L4_9ARAC|nr:hypothetical protein JTE90_016697 [Oedothorax gibbosus]